MASLGGALRSVLDPRTWLQQVRLAHFAGYSHAAQRGRLSLGPGPGAGSHLGENAVIGAGNATGLIVFGAKCLLGPGVVVTASNDGIPRGTPVMGQPKVERDIVLGDDVWLGANVVVNAGVTIGSGAVVGAGAVATRDLPPDCIVGGAPAKVIGMRPEAS
jgi:acetyltransferase-like isoleucine patch superfamily enzyme